MTARPFSQLLICSILILGLYWKEVKALPKPARTSPSSTSTANLRLLPAHCGFSIQDRISNGNVTEVFSYPWMAVLRKHNNSNIVDHCGGSLINKRYILTAAHCLKGVAIHSVVLGEHTKGQEPDCNYYYENYQLKTDCAAPTEVFGIESFEVHQDYNRPPFSNDIGLIRLDRDVIMKDHIKPICLPVTAELQRLSFKKYVVTGWGATEKHHWSNILLKAILPHVDISECQQIMNQNGLPISLSDKQICAGGKNKIDTCKGDSGGPLGFSANHKGPRFVQFGIVSLGVDSCGLTIIPGVFCRVASYMDWIAKHIKP